LVNFAELFLTHGAQVDAKDTEGLTPLHEAAWGNQLEMARLLLAHGADVNARDIYGDTPADVAARNGYQELFQLLVAKATEISRKDDQDYTPTEYAQSAATSRTLILSGDGRNPYAVIILNPSTVREFLRGESILYDRVWIPSRQDIETLDLKAALEKSTHIDTRTWFDLEYIRTHLSGYNREYGGFIRQGRRYVLCNTDFNEFDREPASDFTRGADGGCSLARIVIDLADQTVVRIDCNGN
jgi:hypothetical protein